MRIYKLVTPYFDEVYVGSTSKSLRYRLRDHERHFERYLENKHKWMTSFYLMGGGDVTIEELEHHPGATRDFLYGREEYWQKKLKCVNKQTARCKKTRAKVVKEQTAARQRLHYHKKLVRTDCPCGGRYMYMHKARHFKTDMHKAWAN